MSAHRILLGAAAGVAALTILGATAQPAGAAQSTLPASAQRMGAAPAQPVGCRTVTPESAAGFFDRSVPGRLTQDRVPGLAVSVVADGRTVFARGYGYADAERRVPFSASRTLVRIASITKLFTWTAVMQQMEAGRLDLHTDVNRYLSTFQVPSTYPEPVTLQTLMDHTAGFEDRIIGTGARSAADVPPLGEYLAANMPARIRPAGEVSAYSNYGAALAGHIVAEVSGEPYDRYVQRHILAPLGMTRSTASEPVPAALAADLAHSYNSDGDPLRLVPFQFDRLSPDGAISATATDMARFMAAHLGGGSNGTGRILAPATAELMHARSFAADPRLDGYAHGFKERTINGHRVLMHDGGWEGFVSGLLLVPGCDLGLFVSANATGGTETLTKLVPEFFDRFAPTPATPDADPGSTPDGPTVASTTRAGFYAPTRHNESTVERLLMLLGPVRLTVREDGTVRFKGDDWTPRPDGVYHRADGTDRLAFRTGPGARDYVITDGPSYQLLGRTETLPFNLGVLLAFAVAALSAVSVPVAAAWRRIARRSDSTSATWRWARSLSAGAALLGLAFLGGLAVTLYGDTGEYLYGAPLGFQVLLAVPVVVLVAAAAAAVCTVTGWRDAGARVSARIHQVVLLGGIAALAWFAAQWNLIGWWSI